MDDDRHDETVLPQWARRRLDRLRKRVEDLEDELSVTRSAHSVLTGREWFTLPGPSTPDRAYFHLWYIERDDPRPVCSLQHGDLLLVGRQTKREPEATR